MISSAGQYLLSCPALIGRAPRYEWAFSMLLFLQLSGGHEFPIKCEMRVEPTFESDNGLHLHYVLQLSKLTLGKKLRCVLVRLVCFTFVALCQDLQKLYRTWGNSVVKRCLNTMDRKTLFAQPSGYRQ